MKEKQLLSLGNNLYVPQVPINLKGDFLEAISQNYDLAKITQQVLLEECDDEQLLDAIEMVLGTEEMDDYLVDLDNRFALYLPELE